MRLSIASLLLVWASAHSAVISRATAQVSPTLDVSSRSSSDQTGLDVSALPGLYHLGLAEALPHGIGTSFGLGYGYTEDVLGTDDSHHRFHSTLAIQLAPARSGFFRNLSMGVHLNSRLDLHTSSPESGNPQNLSTDTSFSSDPTFSFRYAGALGHGWSAGVQADIWIPASNFPTVSFVATSPSLRFLLSYQLSRKLKIASHWGARYDRSAESAPDADQLSRADRLSLGVSVASAVLAGVGAIWTQGRWEWMVESTVDWLIGSHVSDPLISPFHLSAGTRYAFNDMRTVTLGAYLDSTLSKRPVVDVGQPLFVVDPRISFMIALGIRFDPWASEHPVVKEVQPLSKPVAEQPTPEIEVQHGEVRLSVRDVSNRSITDASVELAQDDKVIPLTLDVQGEYHAERVPVGNYRLIVRRTGFAAFEQAIDVVKNQVLEPKVILEFSVKGQLKGLVRAFDGTIVPAQIIIETPDHQKAFEATVGTDGMFQINVPPGRYVVRISAEKYRSQTRKVTVEENGVTVLNADLRKDGRK